MGNFTKISNLLIVSFTIPAQRTLKIGISTKTSNLIFVSVTTLSLYYYVCRKVITVLKVRGLTERTCISQTHAGVPCLSCLCKVIKIKTGGVSMQTDTTSQNTPSVYHFIVVFVSAILSSIVQFSCKLELLQVEYLIVRLFVIACNFFTSESHYSESWIYISKPKLRNNNATPPMST